MSQNSLDQLRQAAQRTLDVVKIVSAWTLLVQRTVERNGNARCPTLDGFNLFVGAELATFAREIEANLLVARFGWSEEWYLSLRDACEGNAAAIKTLSEFVRDFSCESQTGLDATLLKLRCLDGVEESAKVVLSCIEKFSAPLSAKSTH